MSGQAYLHDQLRHESNFTDTSRYQGYILFEYQNKIPSRVRIYRYNTTAVQEFVIRFIFCSLKNIGNKREFQTYTKMKQNNYWLIFFLNINICMVFNPPPP